MFINWPKFSIEKQRHERINERDVEVGYNGGAKNDFI
jgi:hypothetical protein